MEQEGKSNEHAHHRRNPTLEEPVTATINSKEIPKLEQTLNYVTTDKEAVRVMFMKSPHVEWAPFARDQGWDEVRTRQNFPIHTWIMDKRRILAQAEAEQLATTIFAHRNEWHKRVLKALKDYPDAHDPMLTIIKGRMTQMLNDMASDQKDPKAHKFKRWKTGDILNLAASLKTLTESKYKSLLIQDFNVKVAQEEAHKVLSEGSTEVDSKEWVIEVTGGAKMTNSDVERFLANYIDKPTVNEPEPPTIGENAES